MVAIGNCMRTWNKEEQAWQAGWKKVVYIQCDKEAASCSFIGFWPTEQYQNKLKEKGPHHYTLHSDFVTIELSDDLNDTHKHIPDIPYYFVSFYFCHCLALSHVH